VEGELARDKFRDRERRERCKWYHARRGVGPYVLELHWQRKGTLAAQAGANVIRDPLVLRRTAFLASCQASSGPSFDLGVPYVLAGP
jgi:hypothetical protein